jgi:hypothetical protein
VGCILLHTALLCGIFSNLSYHARQHPCLHINPPSTVNSSSLACQHVQRLHSTCTTASAELIVAHSVCLHPVLIQAGLHYLQLMDRQQGQQSLRTNEVTATPPCNKKHSSWRMPWSFVDDAQRTGYKVRSKEAVLYKEACASIPRFEPVQKHRKCVRAVYAKTSTACQYLTLFTQLDSINTSQLGWVKPLRHHQ